MAKVFDLQSKNYTELNYTAGGTIVAGAFVTQNDIYGFTLVDVVSGDLTTLVFKAEKVKCARTAATACNSGEKAYYHSGTGLVDNVATAGVLIGHFVRDSASADTHAWVEFDGAINS